MVAAADEAVVAAIGAGFGWAEAGAELWVDDKLAAACALEESGSSVWVNGVVDVAGDELAV